MNWEKELESARLAAACAGALALEYRVKGIAHENKADESPVTAADRAAERMIVSLLSDRFPGDGFLGEEGAAGESRSGRKWIVDPIDGTREYLRGSPLWGNLIGLEVDGEIVVGVANIPALGEMYCAAKGEGAWRDQKRLCVSEIDDISRAVLCFNGLNKGDWTGRLAGFISRFWSARSMGGCYDAMMVASGQADAWIEPSAKPWDLAPLKIIVEEAGGLFFNFDGGASIYGGNCVCCTPGLEGLLRDLPL